MPDGTGDRGKLPRRDFAEEATWAATLDWETNDYDFGQMLRSIVDRLDASYREEFGVRVDQLANQEEIFASARMAATWYQQAHQEYRTQPIYAHLHSDLDRLLRKKARRLVNTRRQEVNIENPQG